MRAAGAGPRELCKSRDHALRPVGGVKDNTLQSARLMDDVMRPVGGEWSLATWRVLSITMHGNARVL